MKFDTDSTKQAKEMIFSRKKSVSIYPAVYFNNDPVNSTAAHKHLGLILDSKLSYENHLQFFFSRVKKTIALVRKLRSSF